METYKGSCHCGAISFSFKSEPITSGLSCNCSMCERKQALMLDYAIAPEELSIDAQEGALSCYQFGNKVAKHYFCNKCGIYPFHETSRQPGHYRVNLGCVDGLDSFNLKRIIFNGRELL